jgi:hypothetical protein
MLKNCKFCAKEFNVPNCLLKRKHYCSMKCYRSRSMINRDFKCLECNKLSIGNGHKYTKERKFCSNKCSAKYHSGDKNHFFKNASVNKQCLLCKKDFQFYPSQNNKRPNRGKFCSNKCYIGSYKGITMCKGYIYIKSYQHPFRQKSDYIPEHRLKVEKQIGRYLTKLEVVHHINHIRSDNRPENLYIFSSNSEHHKFHNHPYPLKSNIINQ